MFRWSTNLETLRHFEIKHLRKKKVHYVRASFAICYKNAKQPFNGELNYETTKVSLKNVIQALLGYNLKLEWLYRRFSR